MDVTVLGSANPCPQPERAGTGLAVEIADDTLLVDTGPLTSYRLIEAGFDFTAIEDVFYTHHHMDHNVDFFHFALMSWYMGRDALTLYGPTGTQDLVDGLLTAFDRHIEDTAQWRHRGTEGLTDITVVDVEDGFEYRGDGWTVTACPTDHAYALDVFAYRFEETATGETVAFSGDTTPLDRIVDFVTDIDLLIHECNIQGAEETPLKRGEAHDRYFEAPYAAYFDWVLGETTQDELDDQLHTAPEEAGRIAERAGVETLVLTHLNARRNPSDIAAAANEVFSGDVRVASDLTTY
ncbi:MAG: MBL fold metallo-hydrolase [Halobacteriales archaeon]